jgi:hypothetical protein
MKNILLLLLLILPVSVSAQKLPDLGPTKVRINEADKTIVAEIDVSGSAPTVKPRLFYYWYSAGSVHSTQGGFSGTLLNGQYTEYYLNKNLKQQGTFKKGLKNGTWKSWNEDGTLSQTATWKKGIMATKTPNKFWKKLHFFRRKPRPDSLAKPLPKPKNQP